MLLPKLALAKGPVPWRAATRALLCMVLVLAHVAAFVHLGLVEHRTCALHGEAVHVGHVAAAARLQPTAPTAVQSRGDVADDDHDHCVCMAPGRQRFVPFSTIGDGTCAFTLACPLGIQLAVGPALPIALLSLAPKSSPPA